MTHESPPGSESIAAHVDVRGLDALARLQLGRALALSGDTLKAKRAYSDLLTLWKDADPEIAIVKEAQAEFARWP